MGLMADKIGHKKLLLFSGIIFLVSPLLYLLVSNPWYLIPIRFFHGIATAILGPVAAVMIFEKYKSQKGEKIGLYSSATLVGRTIAPIVGGAILSYFALQSGLFSYQLVYVAAFVFSLPVIVLILLLRDTAPTKNVKNKLSNSKKLTLGDFKNSLFTFVKDKRLFATALVEMATYFAFGAFETYLPLFLLTKGVLPYEIGLIFSIQILTIALSKPVFGKLSDKIDRRIQIVIGVLIVGMCILAVPLLSTFFEFVVMGLLFGLGMSFSTIATATYVADISKKEELGASVGLFSSVMDVGNSSGPLITGIILTIFAATTYGYFAGFATSFVLCLLAGIWFTIACYTKTKTTPLTQRV
jgi:MFS family permease